MKKRRRYRWVLLVIVLFFVGFVLADALGVFRQKPYVGVPHGNHVHYVPEDRDPDVPVNNFPTQEPGPNERITPNGRVVAAE